MSRTDKDMPYWVTAERWEPDHWGCPNAIPRQRLFRGCGYRECDLPDRPVRRWPGFSAWRREPHCTWTAEYRGRPFSHVPRWYVHHVWTNRERRAVRDGCRRAAAEYRADRGVDVEVSTRQHRHGASWDWE